ncbi:hypothetical protein [Pseudomonas benzenivorans]|uniref:hypothetical protein n=1 Tax=Pseudomonas benzenivorans TaxID=556533 RepID=UPI00351490EC
MKSQLKATLLAFAACISAKVFSAGSVPGIESVQEHEIIGLGTVRVGQELIHGKFGVGKVKEIQLGEDGITIINITFPALGPKWLVAEYANFKRVSE